MVYIPYTPDFPSTLWKEDHILRYLILETSTQLVSFHKAFLREEDDLSKIPGFFESIDEYKEMGVLMHEAVEYFFPSEDLKGE